MKLPLCNVSELDTTVDLATEKAGVTLTPKRKNIYKLLLCATSPLSAYELADRFKKQFGSNIPAMSVYRILSFLSKNNLAHKLHSENKFIGCTLSTRDLPHLMPQFLICSKCSETRELGIEPDVYKSLEASLLVEGFTIEQAQLEIKCLCAKCAKLSKC